MESRPPPVITGESKLDDDSGRQSGRRWSRQGSSEQRPYFERLNHDDEKRSDSHVRRMELELEESKRVAEDSKRRLNALIYIADDLEKRLESEAGLRLVLEEEMETMRADSLQKEHDLHHVIETMEQKLQSKQLQENKLTDQLVRLERELYRMHQKKHEIVKEIRRQEAQDRADGASAIEIIRAQAGKQAEPRPKNELQDEAMAVAYFSQPTPALAEEQGRFRTTQFLAQFLGLSDK